MSIAPFLPGLPVPTTADGALPPNAGDPGSAPAGSAFGDALAAALAGSQLVPPTGASPAPVAGAALPSADVPAPPVDVPVSPVELPVPPAELPVPPVDLPVPLVHVPVPVAAPAVGQNRPVATADGLPDVGAPASRRTTADGTGTAFPSVAVPAGAAVPSGWVAEEAAPAPALRGEVGNSTDPIGNSTADTGKSAGETGNSAVGTPSSVSGTSRAAQAAGASGAVTKAVVQQVFPEVTRIVSTVGTPGGPGNGTHRITLTLQPEQLGEVRVTLVVRDGAVHVRLAGADGAEGVAVDRALASGAPELQRILERGGADARVTVRDAFAPLLPGTPTAGAQAGPDAHTRSETQARQERHDGQGGQTARDQPREQPRRQEPPRASYPIEPTPVAGRLDRTV